MPEPIIEEVGGDFGATVRFKIDESGCFVEFFAAEITGRDADGAKVHYWRKGAMSSEDDTTDLNDAERYVAGSVKWDGCSHINFGDDDGYLHICGRGDVDKLTRVLSEIYERCGVLMKEAGANLLDGEFAA